MGFGFSFGGGSKKSSSTTTTTSKTGLPEDVINAIKGDANGIYSKLKDQGYTEQQIASMNESQLEALQKLNKSGHLDSVIKQTQGGIDKIWDTVNVLDSISDGKLDQTSANLVNDAMSIVNSDILNQQLGAVDKSAQSAVDQANALIGRNLRENEMTSIYRDAAGSGNVGSSRSAIAQGVAMRGAMEKSADVAENIYNQAGTTKAGLTSQMYQNALTQAGQMSQQNKSNQLAGIMGSLQGSGLAMGQMDKLAGYGQQAVENQLQAGNIQQQQDQAKLDNQYMNEMERKLKEAGVTDMNTIQSLLTAMNPLMDKTTTSSTKGKGGSSSFGLSF